MSEPEPAKEIALSDNTRSRLENAERELRNLLWTGEVTVRGHDVNGKLTGEWKVNEGTTLREFVLQQEKWGIPSLMFEFFLIRKPNIAEDAYL